MILRKHVQMNVSHCFRWPAAGFQWKRQTPIEIHFYVHKNDDSFANFKRVQCSANRGNIHRVCSWMLSLTWLFFDWYFPINLINFISTKKTFANAIFVHKLGLTNSSYSSIYFYCLIICKRHSEPGGPHSSLSLFACKQILLRLFSTKIRHFCGQLFRSVGQRTKFFSLLNYTQSVNQLNESCLEEAVPVLIDTSPSFHRKVVCIRSNMLSRLSIRPVLLRSVSKVRTYVCVCEESKTD